MDGQVEKLLSTERVKAGVSLRMDKLTSCHQQTVFDVIHGPDLIGSETISNLLLWECSAVSALSESLPPKRPPVEKQTVCRKKRSVKRHPSRNGRDRQRLALQDRNQLHRKSAEENLSDEEIPYDKLRRVKEEAVSNAERSAKAAISKRAKAQILMANADRAVYLAIKALRIAEIAQQAESSKAPDGLMPKPSFRIAEIAQQAESSKAPDGLIPKPSFRIAEIAQQAESSKAPDGSLPKPPE